ncbi:MAG: iron-sulfur cluster assembly accessory protein [Thaumarchaeota archaeon]|nr:iron-sulfur cluster assembly accessory protein [Candidatus Calditenuaceae archaeon]MDW8042527.1 iron-sulfur cluster assembly accessory protein [Nitrososphaerota archaeon]
MERIICHVDRLDIEVTPLAVRKMKEALKDAGESVGVRIFVSEGCCGPSYGLALDDQVNGDDIVLNVDGVKFLVDSFSAERLRGVVLDYASTPYGEGFVVKGARPSSGGHGCSCGCGH